MYSVNFRHCFAGHNLHHTAKIKLREVNSMLEVENEYLRDDRGASQHLRKAARCSTKGSVSFRLFACARLLWLCLILNGVYAMSVGPIYTLEQKVHCSTYIVALKFLSFKFFDDFYDQPVGYDEFVRGYGSKYGLFGYSASEYKVLKVIVDKSQERALSVGDVIYIRDSKLPLLTYYLSRYVTSPRQTGPITEAEIISSAKYKGYEAKEEEIYFLGSIYPPFPKRYHYFGSLGDFQWMSDVEVELRKPKDVSCEERR